MLVATWDAMNAAIPRLLAEEHLSAYNVGVISSVSANEDSRRKILDLWQEQASGKWQTTIKAKAEHSMQWAFNKVIKALGSGHS